MVLFNFFFYKQKTTDEMRISDWSSDVCSSDLSRRMAGGNSDGERSDQRSSAHALWRHVAVKAHRLVRSEIGRASCRERVCRYVSISMVGVSINNNITDTKKPTKSIKLTPTQQTNITQPHSHNDKQGRL